jgi:hypothetical protein
MLRRPLLSVLAAVLVLACSAAASGQPAVTRSASIALRSPCDHPPATSLAYGWPIKPFHRQHAIRGYFGDPRTLAWEGRVGVDSELSPGSFTFHNGVDIVAGAGTPIYPVVSGRAKVESGDLVVVVTGDGRVFQYYHVHPLVRTGRYVRADRTILGRVLPFWDHVHLSEIDGFRIHNPLDPGHLEPYRDHTTPDVVDLDIDGARGNALDRRSLSGRVFIAASARDLPAIPVPRPWEDRPVTPALVRWRLATPRGKIVIPERTVADFRRTEPPNRDFWRVYAAGTYQNAPRFGRHDYFGRSGRYLFDLTPNGLETRRLRDGAYDLIVNVADTCANRGSFTEQVTIRNRVSDPVRSTRSKTRALPALNAPPGKTRLRKSNRA